MRGAIVLLALYGAAARAETGDEAASPHAHQLAELLGVGAELELIRRAPPPATTEEAVAHLRAVEQAVVELSRASLIVEATIARLQHEQYEAQNAHDALETRRESSVARWNIGAVLIGSGVTIVGSAMQLGNETVAQAGDLVAVAGAVVAAAFSIVALTKGNAGPLPLGIETNMLAPFLDRPATPRSRYADWLWRYLDAPLAGDTRSIRQQLVEKWTHERRLPERARLDERRVELLTRPLRAAQRVDAAALNDRADMLADVRERLAGLSEDLERLWNEVDVHHHR